MKSVTMGQVRRRRKTRERAAQGEMRTSVPKGNKHRITNKTFIQMPSFSLHRPAFHRQVLSTCYLLDLLLVVTQDSGAGSGAAGQRPGEAGAQGHRREPAVAPRGALGFAVQSLWAVPGVFTVWLCLSAYPSHSWCFTCIYLFLPEGTSIFFSGSLVLPVLLQASRNQLRSSPKKIRILPANGA